MGSGEVRGRRTVSISHEGGSEQRPSRSGQLGARQVLDSRRQQAFGLVLEVPLINVKVLGEVDGQALGWRGASGGLKGEVV